VEEVRETMWDVEEEADTPIMRRSSSSRNVDETHPIDGGFDQGSEMGGGGRRKRKKWEESGKGSCLEDSKFQFRLAGEGRGAIIKDGAAGRGGTGGNVAVHCGCRVKAGTHLDKPAHSRSRVAWPGRESPICRP
jgi:hypothetical protein